jgi:hypothetical protein
MLEFPTADTAHHGINQDNADRAPTADQGTPPTAELRRLEAAGPAADPLQHDSSIGPPPAAEQPGPEAPGQLPRWLDFDAGESRVDDVADQRASPPYGAPDSRELDESCNSDTDFPDPDANSADIDALAFINSRGEFVPTPQQIRGECLAIQEGWTPAQERWHRCGLPANGPPPRPRWTVPAASIMPSRDELPD